MSDTEDINIDDIKKIVNKMRNNSSIRKQVKKFQKETTEVSAIEPKEDEEQEIEQEPQEKLKKIPKAKDVKSKQKKKTLDLTISDNEIDNIINIKTKTDNKPKDLKEYRDEDPRLKIFLDILTKKS